MNMLLALLVCSGVASASVDPRLAEAEALAAHGELDSALANTLAVADELEKSGAPTSAALHYNIGTLALSHGDDGLAMLHLLAAQRRAPLDEDTRHNLGVAMQRRADQVDDVRGASTLRRLPRGIVAAFAGVAVALFGALLLRIGVRGPRAPLARRALGLVAAALVSLGVWAAVVVADAGEIVVVMRDTQALPQPDKSAEGFAVHPGLSGDVVAEERGFARVRLENGVDVWIARDDIAAVP